ncbi:MAG: phosphoglycolate phosphatase [Thermoleophilaceae bacterium]|nr:phosphoglycolate phosphatase [Thermoleophilaceae bacterium]
MPGADRPLVVLFDIDGTLIDSGGAGAVSWRQAFQDLYGVPADIGRFSDAGMTDPEVGRRTFEAVVGHAPSASELAQVLVRRQRHLPRAVAESAGYRVLPGVPERLEQLHDDGYPLGLTTGGTEAAAHIKLARAELNHYFCFGGYGSDSPDRVTLTRRAIERGGVTLGQPLDPGRALVVGDTPLDVEAAHGAGAIAVAVATGHFSVEELRATGAEHVLATLEEELPV